MFTPPERLPDRDAAIEAMLPHVPFDGWTRAALVMGLRDAGMPADEADLLFPGGAADMVATWCDMTDRWMETAAAGLTETSLTKRVRAVIALRLDHIHPHREAVRRALAVLALPGHAGVAAGCTARTVDAIWHAAGDRSADFSWYTKRAILTGVYGATLLFWLRDQSDGAGATLAFLDRRLRDVGQIGRIRARVGSVLASAGAASGGRLSSGFMGGRTSPGSSPSS
ncbi:MAG: COQ9 family protein [Acetobacteraceae bacterium]